MIKEFFIRTDAKKCGWKFVNCFLKGHPAFTLLELIIVVVVIAVMVASAMPLVIGAVQYSYSAEAFAKIGAIRQELERCYIQNNESYFPPCAQRGRWIVSVAALPEDGLEGWDSPPLKAINHFKYLTTAINGGKGIRIIATRTTLSGGDGTSTITATFSPSGITRAGTGVFKSIR